MSKAFPQAGECFRLGNHNCLHNCVRVTKTEELKISCIDLLTGATRNFEVRLAGHWYEFDSNQHYTNSYWPDFMVAELSRNDVKKILIDRRKSLYRAADVAKRKAQQFAAYEKETLAAL